MAPHPWLLAASCSPVLVALLSIVKGALANEPSLEVPKPGFDNKYTEEIPEREHHPHVHSKRFIYQAYFNMTAEVDQWQVARDHAADSWEERCSETDGVNYSVIVVEWRRHQSLFRDRDRLRAFDGGSDGRAAVTSVQFASPFPESRYTALTPPFLVEHQACADRRVLVIYATDLVGNYSPLHSVQVSHLRAACEDPYQTCVLALVDETCQRPGVPARMPQACRCNVVRFHPFNTANPDVESRQAYLPLGPRSTFPYLEPSTQRDASDRLLLFNLQVSARTSPTREQLVEITDRYTRANPQVPCVTQSEEMDAGQWQDLLLGSRFTLSPGGHNAETYRMWEALEAGSIPIVSKRDYTHPAYNGTTNCGVGEVAWNTVAASPFAKHVSVNDWTELPALLDRLRGETDHYVDRLQAACRLWYAAAMTRAYESVLNSGEGYDLLPQDGPLFDDVEGLP